MKKCFVILLLLCSSHMFAQNINIKDFTFLREPQYEIVNRTVCFIDINKGEPARNEDWRKWDAKGYLGGVHISDNQTMVVIAYDEFTEYLKITGEKRIVNSDCVKYPYEYRGYTGVARIQRSPKGNYHLIFEAGKPDASGVQKSYIYEFK